MEELPFYQAYWEALHISRMQGEEYLTPVYLKLYFDLYLIHDIDSRREMLRYLLAMATEHHRYDHQAKADAEVNQKRADSEAQRARDEAIVAQRKGAKLHGH